MRRGNSRRTSAAAAVAASLVLTACGAVPVAYDSDRKGSPESTEPADESVSVLGPETERPEGQPRVDLDIAADVLADYDAANNSANTARSDAAITAIESGAMLEIDLASYAASRALDSVRDYESVPFTTGDPVFALQPSTTYPVRFLVVGRQVGEGPADETATTVMQFARTSADTSWRLEHVANVPGDTDLDVAVDENGYVTPAAAPPATDPAAVGPAIVTSLNGSDAGVPFVDDAGPEAVIGSYLEAREVGIGVELSPSDGRTVGSWPLTNGGQLVLTSFRSDFTLRAAAGQELLQPATRDVFSSLLDPGTYAAVQVEWLGLQAWSTSAPDAALALIATYDGVVAASGERTGDAPSEGTNPIRSSTQA